MTEMNGNQTLADRLENLKQINRNRFDYVLARCEVDSVEAALKRIGKSKGWFYSFSEGERSNLEKLADELHYEKAVQAWLLLKDASAKAAATKIEGLESRDQRVKQSAATEILDRTIGKPGEINKLKLEGSVNLIWQPHKPTLAGEN